MGKCMKFIDGLYFGPKAEHNKKELVRKLKKEKYLPGLWLITLPHNEGNILDMVEAYTLPYQGGLKDNLTVAGIAYGRDEALELVRQIVDDTYNKLGTVDRNYYCSYSCSCSYSSGTCFVCTCKVQCKSVL